MNLSKQKALEPDPKAIQQIEFQGKNGQTLRLYTILEKAKEIVLEFYKRTAKVM